MGSIIGVIVIFLIVIGLIVLGIPALIREIKYKLEKAKNSFVSEKGYCMECKHCIKDEYCERSRTGYFCRLSNCENITEDTIMNCVEKPTVTEDDLKTIFDTGIFNGDGQTHVRNEILGRKMSYIDFDKYLSELHTRHPEFFVDGVRVTNTLNRSDIDDYDYKCPKCGRFFDYGTTTCPGCGQEISWDE